MIHLKTLFGPISRNVQFYHDSLTVLELSLPNIHTVLHTILLWFSHGSPANFVSMDRVPGQWPRGLKNINLLKLMLDNTKRDIAYYEYSIRELSYNKQARIRNSVSIKQYEDMAEELKKDYREISEELNKIDRLD